MTHTMTPLGVALKQLALHPQNVRAKSPETYAQDNIAHLKASIAALGLLQPLIIQKQSKGYGVLAGGRRLAALKALAEDKNNSGHAFKVSLSTKIECREVPANCDLTSTISLVENMTQETMSPIDEFEAYAAMMELDGQSPETIAMTFGTTVTSIKERLRYGLVHGDIRAAVRAKTISLDAMKAFASHPCQDAQLQVFKALTEDDDHVAAWAVRGALSKRGIQISDTLGQFILKDYKAAGGPIAADLLEENSVLEDVELINQLLEAKLKAIAEDEREVGGFAWSDAMIKHDWQELGGYGRVYPGPIELSKTDQARLDEIDSKIAKLEDRADDEDVSHEEGQQIWSEIETLNEEADKLQNAYDPQDLKTAGVIVSWNNGVIVTTGLVRKSEMKQDKGTKCEEDQKRDAGDITYAASFSSDLQTERGIALGAALASSPETASDLAMFKLICDVVLLGSSTTQAFDIRASVEYRNHAKIDEIDQTSAGILDAARADLSLDWAAEGTSSVEMFAGFRVLDADEKAKLVAFAVGMSTRPCFARGGNTEVLMGAIEAEVMPNIRDFWKPNEAFFLRLKKAQLLRIITDLGLTQEAVNLASCTKKEVVEFLGQLFTAPFATLTSDQRDAVDTWCPPGMQTAQVKVLAMKPSKTKKKPNKKAA